MGAKGAQQAMSRRKVLTMCGSRQVSPLRACFLFDLVIRGLLYLSCGHSLQVLLQPT